MPDDSRSGGGGRKPPRGPRKLFSGGQGRSSNHGNDRIPARGADSDAPPRRSFRNNTAFRDKLSDERSTHRRGRVGFIRDGDAPSKPFHEGGERPTRPKSEDRPRKSRGPERSRSSFHDRPVSENDRKRRFEPRFESRQDKHHESRPERAGFLRNQPENRSERTPQRHKARVESKRETGESFEGDRIAKVIARVGLGSRRDAEVWIEEGRVAVNDEILTSAARNVTQNDHITVDGSPLPRRERTRLWLYHKPRGLVTTEKDPEGRPTVFANLPDGLPRVLSIGRLDINTEGLLLLTNDGGLARVLELPKTAWVRKYRVRAHGQTNQAALDRLFLGVTVDGIDYGRIEAHLDKDQGANSWLTIGLREGKNREVKNVLASIGLEVNRLIRVSYGPFQLGDLPEGRVEEVGTRVLMDQLGSDLAKEAGCDFEAPTFERPASLPQAPYKNPRRRGLRVKTEGSEGDRMMRGGLIEDRRGRRVLVQRLTDDKDAKPRAPHRPSRDRNDFGEAHAPRPRNFQDRNLKSVYPLKARRSEERVERGERPQQPFGERSQGLDRDRFSKPRPPKDRRDDNRERPQRSFSDRNKGTGERPLKPRAGGKWGGKSGNKPASRFDGKPGGHRGGGPSRGPRRGRA